MNKTTFGSTEFPYLMISLKLHPAAKILESLREDRGQFMFDIDFVERSEAPSLNVTWISSDYPFTDKYHHCHPCRSLKFC